MSDRELLCDFGIRYIPSQLHCGEGVSSHTFSIAIGA